MSATASLEPAVSIARLARGLALGVALMGVSVLLPTAAAAQEREYVIEFLPPEAAVEGYRVYMEADAVSMDPVDLGLVMPDPDGVARSTLLLESAMAYAVEMTAYNAAGESGRSNRITIEPSMCDPAVCNDGNMCTADDCDASGCLHTPLPDGTSCDDGVSDTIDDRCEAGSCVGTPVECRTAADCDDGNDCNGVESCDAGGNCVGGTPPYCGEPTQCAAPICDATTGCAMVPEPDGVACNDGRTDTVNDRCQAGACVGSPVECLTNADCDDGNACNGAETCNAAGSCKEGSAPSCGEPTECAVPMCDPAAGCTMVPEPDGTVCDDGRSDTVDDRCDAGTCRGLSPDLECSIDDHCSDGDVCNGVETCSGSGSCQRGEPIDCGLPTQCAMPACDVVGGCMMIPLPDGAPCDDGRRSTWGDQCNEGVCKGTQGKRGKHKRK